MSFYIVIELITIKFLYGNVIADKVYSLISKCLHRDLGKDGRDVDYSIRHILNFYDDILIESEKNADIVPITELYALHIRILFPDDLKQLEKAAEKYFTQVYNLSSAYSDNAAALLAHKKFNLITE